MNAHLLQFPFEHKWAMHFRCDSTCAATSCCSLPAVLLRMRGHTIAPWLAGNIQRAVAGSFRCRRRFLSASVQTQTYTHEHIYVCILRAGIFQVFCWKDGALKWLDRSLIVVIWHRRVDNCRKYKYLL